MDTLCSFCQLPGESINLIIDKNKLDDIHLNFIAEMVRVPTKFGETCTLNYLDKPQVIVLEEVCAQVTNIILYNYQVKIIHELKNNKVKVQD